MNKIDLFLESCISIIEIAQVEYSLLIERVSGELFSRKKANPISYERKLSWVIFKLCRSKIPNVSTLFIDHDNLVQICYNHFNSCSICKYAYHKFAVKEYLANRNEERKDKHFPNRIKN